MKAKRGYCVQLPRPACALADIKEGSKAQWFGGRYYVDKALQK